MSSILTYIFSAVLILHSLCSIVYARPAEVKKKVAGEKLVKEIVVRGNKATKHELILLFMEIDTGEVFDSSMIPSAKKRLESTGLFAKVDIFALSAAGSVTLYVLLVERPFFTISTIGGDLLERYGKESKVLWQKGRVKFGVTKLNFRGKMESLTLTITLLEWRSLGVSWHKPFLKTPYYLNLSAGISDEPSQVYTLRTQRAYFRSSAGRRFGNGIVLYAGFKPRIVNTMVIENDIRKHPYIAQIDSSDLSNPVKVWDTVEYVIPTKDTWFIESHIFSGLNIDKRDRAFDSRKGWKCNVSFQTNPLHPSEKVYRNYDRYQDSSKIDNKSHLEVLKSLGYTFDREHKLELLSQQYFQLYSQFQFYHRGFFERDRFAYRTKLLLRDRDGGILNRVGAGGESSLRGYGNGTIDNNRKADNLAAFSMEYRFPIFTTPTFDMFSDIIDFSKFGYDLSGFYYRLDGCLFFDAAYVWNKWSEPYHPRKGHEDGYSIGLGFRVMLPTLARSIAWDIVPLVEDPATGKFEWGWRWNLYIDLHF
ncbi:MAG: BamA/TamA family outer membrane protein [Chitinivibrionales bacterium]|nr:BamA/TamA family outer membrane protein [Chitinivibrionales bacterium]